jgi:hypothetical protein
MVPSQSARVQQTTGAVVDSGYRSEGSSRNPDYEQVVCGAKEEKIQLSLVIRPFLTSLRGCTNLEEDAAASEAGGGNTMRIHSSLL